MSDTEQRLIDANELKRVAYQRFGLSAIKLITLVDEMPTATDNTLHGEKDNEQRR